MTDDHRSIIEGRCPTCNTTLERRELAHHRHQGPAGYGESQIGVRPR